MTGVRERSLRHPMSRGQSLGLERDKLFQKNRATTHVGVEMQMQKPEDGRDCKNGILVNVRSHSFLICHLLLKIPHRCQHVLDLRCCICSAPKRHEFLLQTVVEGGQVTNRTCCIFIHAPHLDSSCALCASKHTLMIKTFVGPIEPMDHLVLFLCPLAEVSPRLLGSKWPGPMSPGGGDKYIKYI